MIVQRDMCTLGKIMWDRWHSVRSGIEISVWLTIYAKKSFAFSLDDFGFLSFFFNNGDFRLMLR